MATIAIASDHAGFELKAHLAAKLRSDGHELIDLGTDSSEPVDYPPFCAAVGRAVRDGTADAGIVNKVRGVRAALCNGLYTARLARAHNDANVLAIGARVVGIGLAEEIVDTFLATPFDGGRHAHRVDMITALESEF
jgi:ribose 5-phosphate isomerase B